MVLEGSIERGFAIVNHSFLVLLRTDFGLFLFRISITNRMPNSIHNHSTDIHILLHRILSAYLRIVLDFQSIDETYDANLVSCQFSLSIM